MPVSIGLSARACWLDALLAEQGTGIDHLDLMVDDLFDSKCETTRAFRRLGAKYPLFGHGVNLGVGNAIGVDRSYVESVAEVIRRFHFQWYSEHLAFTRTQDVDLGHFAPLDDDPETIGCVANNAQIVRQAVGVPMLLENPADILGWGTTGIDGGCRMGTAYAKYLQATHCGALLDVTNLLYGARNDGYAPRSFLEQIPWDRVVQLHVAGGRSSRGFGSTATTDRWRRRAFSWFKRSPAVHRSFVR